MMHRAWSSIVEVPYCFSRSYVKFRGHTALKIVKFYPNWAFPDCNSSLNSPMAMTCCTKLETVKERCPIVFQGHPSNFKVTRYKTSPILTQIGHFRTIGRSQLSNPSDLPCCSKFGNCNFNWWWVMAWTSSKWGKFWLWSSIWPWRSRSIVPQNNRDLNQGLLHLWFKFGDPSWKGWWVIARTSSWLTHGRTHTQTDTRRQRQYPKAKTGLG